MRTVRVAAAIIMQNGRVLAAQRGYGPFAGGWEFPGGKIEPGETPAQACAREAREELSVEIGNLRPFFTVEHDYADADPAFHLSMDCFTCRIASGSIHDTEHTGLRWLTAEELGSVAWLPADVELIERLRAHMTGACGKEVRRA